MGYRYLLCILYLVCFVTCVRSSDETDPQPVDSYQYNEQEFTENLPSKAHFIMFYAPWCGHCQRLKPVWEQVADEVNTDDDQDVMLAKVDCTTETKLCSDEGVVGYPTLKLYLPGRDPVRHKGSRDLESLRKFVSAALDPLPEPPVVLQDDGLYELTSETFEGHIGAGHHFIKFYAPWCGHCKRLEPIWLDLAKSHIPSDENADDVKIGRVDCTKHKSICSQHGVQGYPTLLWFENGKMTKKYQNKRDIENLKDFIKEMLNVEKDDQPTPQKTSTDKAIASPNEGLYDLVEDNFEGHISAGHHFIKFYAPWCGHCKRLEPTWLDLAKSHIPSDENADDVKIGRVDCTKNNKLCSNHEVHGYPSLLWFKDGKMLKKYQRGRDIENFNNFINEMMNDKKEIEGDEEGKTVKIEPSPVFKEEEKIDEGPVLVLDDNNFDFHTAVDVTFVKFYAPWCGFCKRLVPVWEELASDDFSEVEETIKIAKVDCTKNTPLCQKYEVRGYPTLMLFKDGEKVEKYSGNRAKDDLKLFVIKNASKKLEAKDEL